jgi:S-DNA-T family DNA segregation ATPase FtsK/SpoIIIE
MKKEKIEKNNILEKIFKKSIKLIIYSLNKYKLSQRIKIILGFIIITVVLNWAGLKLHKVFLYLFYGLCTIIYLIFFFKAIAITLIEIRLEKKYKNIINLFDKKVKILHVTDSKIILNSYISYSEIKRKIDTIEHNLNRKIANIVQDSSNLRKITIYFYNDKNNASLRKNYFFDEWIYKLIRNKKFELYFAVGVDDKGNILEFDLIETTHLFIAGMQGGGKSNILNVIIQTLMYFNQDIYYIMVDFKEVEMAQYEDFNNCFVVPDDESEFIKMIDNLLKEIKERYKKIKSAKVKKISQYNKINPNNKMAYIVLIIDEFADVKLGMENDKELEKKLTMILNKGRACGVIAIIATQRPSADQMNTSIRDRLGTVFSGRVKDVRTQGMVGIKGTENLRTGQFMSLYFEKVIKFKSFFIEEIERNKVYEHLKSQYESQKREGKEDVISKLFDKN